MFTINILSNEEFDSLPLEATKGSNISNSLGFANRDTGQAYVRYTAVPDLNKYLVDHEFEELIESESAHEDENGIRHKSLGEMFGSVGRGAGSLFSGAKNALGSFGSAFGGATSQQPVPRTSFPGQVPLGAIVGHGFNTGYGAVNPSAKTNSFPGSSLINSKNLLGAGLLGAGLFRPLPKAPDISGITDQLRNQLQSTKNPLADQRLNERLGQQFDPLSSEEITAATRQLERDKQDAEDQLRDLYRNIRPGTDPSTDSAFNRDLQDINQRFSESKADLIANRARSAEQVFNQQQMQAIQTSLGASDTEMQRLAEIAQLDAFQIAQQLGLDLEQAELFKSTLTGLGGQLLLSGLNASPLSLFGLGG